MWKKRVKFCLSHVSILIKARKNNLKINENLLFWCPFTLKRFVEHIYLKYIKRKYLEKNHMIYTK